MNRYVLDRFEGNRAVLEDDQGRMQSVDRGLLPVTAREGDVLSLIDGYYRVDEKATFKRRIRIQKLMDNIFKDSD